MAAWAAVGTIDQRLRKATDRRLRTVLEHDRAEMLTWHQELDAKAAEHERATFPPVSADVASSR